MGRRHLAVLGSATVLLAAMLTGASGTAASAATCPNNSWQGHGSVTAKFLGDAVHIRTGPSTTCTSIGLAYKSHSARLICRTGDWSAVTDVTTGKNGWILSSYVDKTAVFPC